MASIYDDDIAEAYDDIVEAGAAVNFVSAGGQQPVYDPLTGLWTPQGGGTLPVAGKAVEVEGDAQQYIQLELVDRSPVTLLVAAKGLTVVPAAGMLMLWAGTQYTVKAVQPTAPDGTPIMYKVVASV